MSDLDQQLRDLLQERAATAGPPPSLPSALCDGSPVPWWRRRPEWLVVPAVAVGSAVVVIAVAVVDANEAEPMIPADQAQSWARQVCTTRPSGPSPSEDELGGMAITASAVCRWENAVNLGDDTVGLQSVTTLSASQVNDLRDLLTAAPEEQPACAMFDSPPPVEYNVYLRDADGRDWRINIPEPPCLGFDMSGGQYQSPDLVRWLSGLSEVTQPAIERELPSEVTRRARALLGDRFVDLRVGADQASYIIGVLDLQGGEVDDFTSRLERELPLYFEQRTVPASDIEELRRTIERAIAVDRRGVRVIGSDLQHGRVWVGVAEEAISSTAALISDTLPGAQTITNAAGGSALICGAGIDTAQPCVVVKAVGLVELTDQ